MLNINFATADVILKVLPVQGKEVAVLWQLRALLND